MTQPGTAELEESVDSSSRSVIDSTSAGAEQAVVESPSDEQPRMPRRHDLDALRAVAMLLGIALHVALSFSPAGWIVTDTQTHKAFEVFVEAIHGFRMPLFFLISGYFTAMLIEKSGVWRTARHRFMRVFLPMLLGLFTIVPLMNKVTIDVMKQAWGGGASVSKEIQENPGDEKAGNNVVVGAGRWLFDYFAKDIFTAARNGDVASIQSILDAATDEKPVDLEQRGPTYKLTALHLASLFGHADAVELLASAGADVNARSDDNGTPLHAAVFLGYADVAEVLIEQGANPHLVNDRGESPRSGLGANWELTKFIANLIQVPVKRADVETGRAALEPALKLAEQTVERPAETRSWQDRYQAMIRRPIYSMPMFNHLWFLNFLCWMCVGLFVVVGLGCLVGIKSLPSWPILSPACYLWLVPLTLLPTSLMNGGAPSFGPDTSIGVLPYPHTLAYYALFFGFGAWYWTCKDSADPQQARLARFWPITLTVSLGVLLPLGLEFTKGHFGWGEDVIADSVWRSNIGLVLQATYAWAMSLACMGLFRWVLQRENKVVRYVSDSSYWLYLAHLPLVIWLQFEVRSWPQPAWGKFVGLCVVCSVLLLISYQILVRHTPIGWLLNGRRRGRAASSSIATQSPLGDASVAT